MPAVIQCLKPAAKHGKAKFAKENQYLTKTHTHFWQPRLPGTIKQDELIIPACTYRTDELLILVHQ